MEHRLRSQLKNKDVRAWYVGSVIRWMASLSFLLSLTVAPASGQVDIPASSADSIKILTGFGLSFMQADRELTLSQVMFQLRKDERAFEEIKKARNAKGFADFMGGVGGALVGWPIGTAIGGGDPNWALAGIGAGLIAVSLPILASYRKKAKGAINSYNRGLRQTSFKARHELKFSMIGNGVGLLWQF